MTVRENCENFSNIANEEGFEIKRDDSTAKSTEKSKSVKKAAQNSYVLIDFWMPK